jgi:spore coat protein U-like protein
MGQRVALPRCVQRAAAPAIAPAALMLLAPALATAGSSTATFTVSATVAATCQLSAGTLSFGQYSPGSGTTLHASTTINVQCTSGTNSPTLSLNAGTSGGTMTTRLMLGPSGTKLQYNLYTSGTYATVFGDGTLGSSKVPVTITGNSFATPVQVTVYGQLQDSAANQSAATPGAYADTITATLTY